MSYNYSQNKAVFKEFSSVDHPAFVRKNRGECRKTIFFLISINVHIRIFITYAHVSSKLFFANQVSDLCVWGSNENKNVGTNYVGTYICSDNVFSLYAELLSLSLYESSLLVDLIALFVEVMIDIYYTPRVNMWDFAYFHCLHILHYSYSPAINFEKMDRISFSLFRHDFFGGNLSILSFFIQYVLFCYVGLNWSCAPI